VFPYTGPTYGHAYPSIWGCIPINWGTPIHGSAFPYIGEPQCMGMHFQILGCPSALECISIYWGTPVFGNTCPFLCALTPAYMGMHSHLEGCPKFMGKHSHILGAPVDGNGFPYNGNAFPHTGCPSRREWIPI
jgi:hypothetical protein